jgi:hypothetical protein
MQVVQVYHVIIDSISPEWLEFLSWGAQLFLVFVAIGAGIVAVYQLSEMSTYRSQRLRIANAQLLMQLDNRWDSQALKESRLIFNAMHDEILVTVGAANPAVNDTERKRHIALEWANMLREKRKASREEYASLMAMCGFFETVGLMVGRDYVRRNRLGKLLFVQLD